MCLEWIDRGRLVCLLSSSLLHAIISLLSLTSQMTDRLLAAFPVLVGFPLPLSHSSPHFVFWQLSAMCVHHPEGSASEVKGVRNMSQRVVVGFFSFPSELIWGEILRHWMSYEKHCSQFSILHCSSFCSLSFLIPTSLDGILRTEVTTDSTTWNLVIR